MCTMREHQRFGMQYLVAVWTLSGMLRTCWCGCFVAQELEERWWQAVLTSRPKQTVSESTISRKASLDSFMVDSRCKFRFRLLGKVAH